MHSRIDNIKTNKTCRKHDSAAGFIGLPNINTNLAFSPGAM